MLIHYDVKPLVGIGPVLLGMSRAESRCAMGQEQPETFKKSLNERLTDAYHGSSFQVIFDAQDRVEYIELSPSDTFAARYKGVDIHRTKAVEIVALISKDSTFDPDDPELEYSYIFPALELSVWRTTVPEDEEDSDGQTFATVGVGRQGYYSE